ncbi:hypothetical protein ACBJ59_58035 [Nonomuraea sp. MTCD27]|uniref:hypothetical protein n=1 Tax=Nonomuraea sp. MTCD27 TaxID=1676747 RepID=UPI0035BFAC9D
MRLPPSHFEYHSLHVAAPFAQSARVDWARPLSPTERVRVREHSCVCTYPMFEFCTLGGLWFVRQLISEDPKEIWESPRIRARPARELWLQIMTGQAR